MFSDVLYKWLRFPFALSKSRVNQQISNMRNREYSLEGIVPLYQNLIIGIFGFYKVSEMKQKWVLNFISKAESQSSSTRVQGSAYPRPPRPYEPQPELECCCSHM